MMSRWRGWLHELRIAAHAVWIGARDPQVPLPVRLFGLFVAGYALSPIDLVPDFIPVLGLIDDALLVPLGVWLFVKMIPAEAHARHRAEAEAAEHRPVSRTGAVVIGLVWLVALAWIGLLLYAGRYY